MSETPPVGAWLLDCLASAPLTDFQIDVLLDAEIDRRGRLPVHGCRCGLACDCRKGERWLLQHPEAERFNHPSLIDMPASECDCTHVPTDSAR